MWMGLSQVPTDYNAERQLVLFAQATGVVSDEEELGTE